MTVSINLSFLSPKPTGLSTYALNLVPALDLPDLTLLSPIDRQQFLPNHLPTAPIYSVPKNLNPSCGKAGHFRRLQWTQFQVPKIQQELRSPLFFSLIPEAPLFTNHRAIVVVHDIIPLRFPNWKSPLTYYFRHYIPEVLNQADHIICNSIATAKDISQYFNIPAQKLTPIPLAHDPQNFRPLVEPLSIAVKPQPLLKRTELEPTVLEPTVLEPTVLEPTVLEPTVLEPTAPTQTPRTSDEPYFFYYGRHDPYKNIHRVITAFAMMYSEQFHANHDCQLWIAGSADPRYTPRLMEQAIELGIGDRVHFLDYVSYSELPIYLNQAIALVFPSLWEGFGFPVLEAMACGTPVITSNLSSLPEVAGDAALLVDPYNEVAIADAMRQVLEDSEVRSQLRRLGLARAAQFSWANTGAETSAVLRSFL
jgi:glycosyltransferase involved in cell wall biosynthesis